MKIFILSLFISYFSSEISACSCIPFTSLEKEIELTDIIVTGKILSRKALTEKDGPAYENNKWDVKYEVLVKTILKGKISDKILTVITGQGGGGSCGYIFKNNEDYIIYASYVTVQDQEVLMTSVCTSTGEFSQEKSEKISQILKSTGSR